MTGCGGPPFTESQLADGVLLTRGADMASIPESHADILKKKAFANLATLNADGSPQVTPVWVDFDGKNVLINTARDRVKTRNLEREKRVALSIADPENPYRYVSFQGRVTGMR